jgi:hypothetical protein
MSWNFIYYSVNSFYQVYLTQQIVIKYPRTILFLQTGAWSFHGVKTFTATEKVEKQSYMQLEAKTTITQQYKRQLLLIQISL